MRYAGTCKTHGLIQHEATKAMLDIKTGPYCPLCGNLIDNVIKKMTEKQAKLRLDCIDTMFVIAGYNDVSSENIVDVENWRELYHMDEQQFDRFRMYVQEAFRREMPEPEASIQASEFIISYCIPVK